jgi:hypothetical protein
MTHARQGRRARRYARAYAAGFAAGRKRSGLHGFVGGVALAAGTVALAVLLLVAHTPDDPAPGVMLRPGESVTFSFTWPDGAREEPQASIEARLADGWL